MTKLIGVLVAEMFLLALAALIVWPAWNYGVTAAMGWHHVTYLQAFAICAVIHAFKDAATVSEAIGNAMKKS